MDRLDKAILAFEDESSDSSMGERIANLRSALQWSAFDRLKRIKKGSKKSPAETEADEEADMKHIECFKQFQLIEKMYISQLKLNKLTGKALDEGLDKDWLKEIKGSNPIGSIVRSMQEKTA